MSVDECTSLEIWDLRKPPIPPRSRLYHLEPIGVGTLYTESLSSYLCRLAQEHCVTFQKLVMGEIAPQMMEQDYEVALIKKNISALFSNSDAKPAINGMREKTQSLVQALKELTQRKDLKFLSLLTWKGVINERELFRQYRAWCPQCNEQWRQEKKVIYEPLLWSFRQVNTCLNHRCTLVDKCPHCGSRLPVIANSFQLGFCSRCKGWLGSGGEESPVLTTDELEWTQYKITSIGELIAVAPKLGYQPSLEALTRKLQLISFCFERVVNQDLTQFIRLGKLMDQLKIALTQHYDKPFHLSDLVIPVCYQAKISIPQLFLEDFNSLSTILFSNFKINYCLS
ncbi:TniQ family protein [Coleofasciculus sp. FACHB-129]|uniref:TniQ family protein n=1 Tax=Cyanophyceae TaxID=3028117 RepID=UPI0016892377|nr:TniQ family protein [Coleofasciculus sp. FACHB-129]MBD1897729.1 TniQ family protein [Coleofasciculus sp. FACHB-129]